MLTKQEVNNWKMDPVTKEVFRRFEEDVKTIMTGWATGLYKNATESEYNRGIIRGISMVINFEGDEDEL